MAFLEFFNKHKEQESNLVNKSSSEHSVLYPHHNYANKNVAKLFESKQNKQSMNNGDIELSEPTATSSTKRNSKSEENIFEKIEASTKKYGTLPKNQYCINDNAQDNLKVSELFIVIIYFSINTICVVFKDINKYSYM